MDGPLAVTTFLKTTNGLRHICIHACIPADGVECDMVTMFYCTVSLTTW
jgi:hypothetical protein